MREYRDEHQFRVDVQKLIGMMGEYKPDVIVPLLRGGLAPCVYIAEQLGIMDIRPISVERKGDVRVIVYPQDGNIGVVNGLDILLLEDDIPTGKSLLHAKNFYEAKGARIKVAAVYVLPQTKKLADFFGIEMDPLPDMYFKPSRSGDRTVR